MQTTYFEKRAFCEPLIRSAPDSGLGIIVTIPAHREDGLIRTLTSLTACDLPDASVEVIVLINQSEVATAEVRAFHLRTYEKARSWAASQSASGLRFHILKHLDLPARHAGVGLARKILMDEAARRLFTVNHSDGIILALDADCSVSANYLTGVEQGFATQPEVEGFAIHFEHPFQDLAGAERRAIVSYELHLRYLVEAQRWAAYPYAFQTVGSSMAVRAKAYIDVGGMNKRQAGEDFYFLQKVIERGHFGEITNCTVYPSARVSDRVPFGTGKAVGDLLKSDQLLLTYHPEAFRQLKDCVSSIELLCTVVEADIRGILDRMPAACRAFLLQHGVEGKLREIHEHTASDEARVKRFYRWFNAFRVIRYLHDFRDAFVPDVPVAEAAAWLLRELGYPGEGNPEALLLYFRERARGIGPN